MVNEIEFTDRSVAFVGEFSEIDVKQFCRSIDVGQVFIITDENVDRHIASSFSLGPKRIIKPGETSKSIEEWSNIQNWLAESGADRASCVLAIGGGVVTDLAGFAAATYMRGIEWIAIATSLMAQLDAAHGGKTGIDLPSGKNQVGSFHMPRAVWCNPKHLETLPVRELRNGLAEAIKYGYIFEPYLLEQLKADPPPYAEIVETCIGLKAKVVRADPLERTGRRAVLNFGHTVAHAIESAMHYQGILHGEAVMIGMIVEAKIGTRLGITDPELPDSLKKMAEVCRLPAELPTRLTAEILVDAMKNDKKASNGRLAMSLLERVGECRLVKDIDESIVQEVLESA